MAHRRDQAACTAATPSRPGLIASQCHAGAYANRFVVVVDDDIDPADMDQVVWAMCTRFDPREGMEILRGCWSTVLDPMAYGSDDPRNARVVIDACRPWSRRDTFPDRGALQQGARRQDPRQMGASVRAGGTGRGAPLLKLFCTIPAPIKFSGGRNLFMATGYKNQYRFTGCRYVWGCHGYDLRFLRRKGVASAPVALPVSASPVQQTPSSTAENNEPRFADLGARIGEGNETLRNLLIDTDRRITALDDVKSAFRNLVEPIGHRVASARSMKRPTMSACATRSRRYAPGTIRRAANARYWRKERRNRKATISCFAGNWRWRNQPRGSRATRPSSRASS